MNFLVLKCILINRCANITNFSAGNAKTFGNTIIFIIRLVENGYPIEITHDDDIISSLPNVNIMEVCNQPTKIRVFVKPRAKTSVALTEYIDVAQTEANPDQVEIINVEINPDPEPALDD